MAAKIIAFILKKEKELQFLPYALKAGQSKPHRMKKS